MIRRTLLTLALSTVAFATLGCDDMADGPSEPADPIGVSVDGALSTHVGLLWMSALFENPDAPGRVLAGLPVGTAVPIADGVIDLGRVDPPFGIYARACEGFGAECDDEIRDLEAADAYALARLVTTSGALGCTFDDIAGCTFDDHVHAPGHLVLFVDAPFDPGADPYLGRGIAPGVIGPGVYLIQVVSTRDMTIVPFDADTVHFVAGSDPVNFF